MPEPVYLIATARTDFKRNLKKEGKSLRDAIVEPGRDALRASGLDPKDLGAGVVGNFAAGLFTRQLHLGAFLTEIDESLRGLPTSHVEGACASGSLAVIQAVQLIAGGIHDAVLVVGAEQQKTMSSADGGDVLAAAGDFHHERSQFGDFMFPKLFGRIAESHMKKCGLTERQLAVVAAKNYAHAKLNPLAQMRDNTMTVDFANTISERNPLIASPLRLSDCSQITDGGAALVLVSGKMLAKLGATGTKVRLLGYGVSTDHLRLEDKQMPEFPIARLAAQRAYTMSGIKPNDADGVEVHDCFSITEVVATELLGLAPMGRGGELAESGATALPQVRESLGLPKPATKVIPVNAGGGLIADGHPVGGTGVRQVVEAATQLRGEAGARQIENAKTYLTFNMGGSLTTSVVMAWGRE